MRGSCNRPPHDREELSSIRGIDGRLRDAQAADLLNAVAAGTALRSSALRLPDTGRVDRSLAPAVTVLGAWLAQRASELDLDPALLGTRAELTQLLQGQPSRLGIGWRDQLVGAPLRRILAGDTAIVLRDGGRRIELDEGTRR